MAQGSAAEAQRPEHNKKWRCYLLICVTSLTNFVSVRETFDAELSHQYYHGTPHLDVFGIVAFAASLLILLLDLTGFVRDKFDFKSVNDGKLEGWTLFAFLLWWAGGVTAITRAGAVGYAALNIYFSAWASLFACLGALDQWGGEKEILTLRQLTGISITLPHWWIVFWASLVTLGSAADARSLTSTQYVLDSTSFAIGESTVAVIVSAFFVLSHYEFFPCCRACASWLTYGGVFELAISILLNIWLIVAVEQLTGAGAIASTITGYGGTDPTSEDYVPGTNIFVSVWAAFIASAMVTAKWKEARAIRFAQTSGGAVAEEDEEVSEDVEKGGSEAKEGVQIVSQQQ